MAMPSRRVDMEDEQEHDSQSKLLDLHPYQCERCGYHYKKVFDYPPFLCYRCMRFIAKRSFVIMHTIQPPTSRPEAPEI